MPNAFCDSLGITPPSLLDVATGPSRGHLDALVLTLLARGEPMDLDEVVAFLAPTWAGPRAMLRVSLQKAWAGREPVVKAADGRFTLDLESWRLKVILDRLGLLPRPPAPPAPPEPVLPASSVPLTLDELKAAFPSGCPWSISGIRFAAGILDALDRPMLPLEISGVVRAWTSGWIPTPGPSPKRSTPGLVTLGGDGRLVLNRESPDLRTMRTQIRARALPTLRRQAVNDHYQRLFEERKREEAARLAALPQAPRKPSKVSWRGTLTSVQPRIRLTRSFDERSHAYLGYVLRVRGDLGGEAREFLVAIGKAAHETHGFCIGDEVSGEGVGVEDPDLETADLYRVSGLRVGARGPAPRSGTPPCSGIPPPLEEYRARGHRRLAALTYRARCESCIWGAEMAVELVIDQWDPSRRKHRRETFCYGPKSCALYAAGPARRVPGRRGMSWTEEDWVDDDATAHRREDE